MPLWSGSCHHFRPSPADPKAAWVALQCLHTSLRTVSPGRSLWGGGGRRSGEKRQRKRGRVAGQDRYPSHTVDPGLVSFGRGPKLGPDGPKLTFHTPWTAVMYHEKRENPVPHSTWKPAAGLSLDEGRNLRLGEPVFFLTGSANALGSAHRAGRGISRLRRTERR